MLEPRLFASRAFSAGIAGGMLSYLVLFGTMLAVPFFLERSRGSGPGHAGLVLSALPLALGAVAVGAGRAAERFGPGRLAAAGMALCAGALFVLGLTTPSSWALGFELAVAGAGLGLFLPANNSSIMGAAPRDQAGVASGVLNMTRGVGTAVGLALTGVVIGGSLRNPGAASAGFEHAALLLAALSALAGTLTAWAARGPVPHASAALSSRRPRPRSRG